MSKQWIVYNSISGHEFGAYQADTADDAIAMMVADSGDTEPDRAIKARETFGDTYEKMVVWLRSEPREIRGDDYRVTAKEWADTGIDFDLAIEYIDSGCFDPASARILADAGITPSRLDVPVDDHDGYTAGYAFASGIISLNALKRII